MSDDSCREYMILREVLSGTRGRDLLGSVIYQKHHTRPDDNYVPFRDKFDDSQVERINELFIETWQTPNEQVDLEDLIKDRSNTPSGQVSRKIFHILDNWVKREKTRSHTITAGKTKRYAILNPGQKLAEKYRIDGLWWDEVTKLYDQADHTKPVVLYLITGVWLCTDMVVRASDASSTRANSTHGRPHLAPPINYFRPANHSDADDRGETIPGDVVFAVKCHSLELIEELKPQHNVGWWPFTQQVPAKKSLVGLRLGLPVPGSLSLYVGGAPPDDKGEDASDPLRYFYVSTPAFAGVDGDGAVDGGAQ